METVTINGVDYSIGTLNAKQQWNVARRIAPAFAAGLGAVAALEDSENLQQIAAGFVPVAEMLAKMPDAESDYVIDTCLSVCKRQQEKGWAKVTTPTGQLMFNINMDEMLELAVEVIKKDVVPFFPKRLLESMPGPGSPSIP